MNNFSEAYYLSFQESEAKHALFIETIFAAVFGVSLQLNAKDASLQRFISMFSPIKANII
jgi:hypothetical protein